MKCLRVLVILIIAISITASAMAQPRWWGPPGPPPVVWALPAFILGFGMGAAVTRSTPPPPPQMYGPPPYYAPPLYPCPPGTCLYHLIRHIRRDAFHDEVARGLSPSYLF